MSSVEWRGARSLGGDVELLLLEVWWDALHDLLGLGGVVDLEGVKVLGSAQLELGNRGLLVLLDSDLFSLGQVLLLSPHDLDEFLQIFDFLWLHKPSQLITRTLTIVMNLNNNTKQTLPQTSFNN